jgi:hypothetical protein
MDGGVLVKQAEAFRIETSGGVARDRCVSPGAGQGGVVVGAGDQACAGVALETVSTAGRAVTVQTEGVAKVTAAGVIEQAGEGLRTPVVMAADGLVQAVPATAGTYHRVGYLHLNSAAAAAEGDRVTVELDCGLEVVAEQGE